MAYRSRVLLALAPFFVTIQFGLLGDYKRSLTVNTLEWKRENNSTSSVVDTQNVPSSSVRRLDPLPARGAIVDGTASSPSYRKLYQAVNPSRSNATGKTAGSKGTPNQFKKKITQKASPCCLRPSIDLEKKFTPEFFEDQRSYIDHKTKWTGKEYDEWLSILERLNPTHQNLNTLDCQTQYYLLALDQVSGYFLRTVMNELGRGKLGVFPYYQETPGLPRILLLGDSISRGIRSRTQTFYKEQANIQGAPTNCMGFETYKSGLKEWLGYCSWDLVQFNVGMHFHPEFPDNYTSWREEYRQGIIDIVNEIRAHSPTATIVFALTTPSPLDSKATTPDKATCPHYDKFHKAGFVPAMNQIAISVAEEYGLIINDRYTFILPVLEKYQNKCDVHLDVEGSKLVAKQDWKIISGALHLAVRAEPGR